MSANIIPQFTIADIQIDVGDHEFQKALALYEKGAVKNIEEDFAGYSAVVLGSHAYEVRLIASYYDRGYCDCYLGLRNELCKHMIALAIALVYKYRPNDVAPIQKPLDQAVSLGEVRDITLDEVVEFKKGIKEGLKYIKSYGGGSAKWFQYQDSLTKGSRLILLALSTIPVCEKSALLCIDTLKRIEKKLLQGGVDDSDGQIGELMRQIIELLNMFASLDNTLKKFIKTKLPKGEIFDWEADFVDQ